MSKLVHCFPFCSQNLLQHCPSRSYRCHFTKYEYVTATFDSFMYNDIACFIQAVTKMVQEAYTYVEKTPNMEIKLKLIDTLRTITAGKVNTIICILYVFYQWYMFVLLWFVLFLVLNIQLKAVLLLIYYFRYTQKLNVPV